MNLALRQNLFNKKLPWDYRVEYFEIDYFTTSLIPLFNCGKLIEYNKYWALTDTSHNSDFQRKVYKGFSVYQIFTFPKSLSTDQKICGGPGIFCAYPYGGKYNFGSFYKWCNATTTNSWSSVGNINTLTRIDFHSSYNNDTLLPQEGTITQGNITIPVKSSYVELSLQTSQDDFTIFGYVESGQIQQRNLYAGTRFYDLEMNFETGDEFELHLRFLPCIKNEEPYICEIYSGKMIPLVKGATVKVGNKVPLDYISMQKPSL